MPDQTQRDRKRRRLGWLFYATVIGSVAIVASMPIWPMAVEQFGAWESCRGLRATAATSPEAAAEALVRLGPAAIPWADSATRDADPRVGILACTILRRIAPALPWGIIRSLREVSPASVGPVASLMAASLGGASARDINAIVTLEVIGLPEAMRAVPALDRAAVSLDLNVATRAIALLATLDPRTASSHVPSLTKWMGRGHPVEIRVAAMNALGQLGPLAKSVVPKLIEAAEEDEIRISSAAIAALSRIDPSRGLALKRSILRVE